MGVGGDPDTIRIVSVNVAVPAVLGHAPGHGEVVSAIGKRPVTAPVLRLTETNLEGDRQADLRVHGGRDKAVYAYPVEHLEAWSQELGQRLGPGAFGENLTLAGVTEPSAAIGDVWAWGDALLQVSQPRWPCFKLALHRDRPDVPDRMIETGRSGMYLRVLRPATVPVAGPLRVVERDGRAISVRRAQRAAVRGAVAAAEVEEVLAHPALAQAWGSLLRARLAAAENARP